MAAKSYLDLFIRAYDEASKVVKGVGDTVNSSVDAMGSAMVKGGIAMTGLGIGAKLMADDIKSTYLPFEGAMTEVKALGGLTTSEFAKMKKSAVDLSTQYPISATDVANAMYLMVSVGYDYQDMMKTIPDAAALATAGSMSMEEATNSLINVMGVYGDKAGDAADISKVFANAVGVGKYEMNDFMTEIMKNIGIAGQLGIEFSDLATYNVALQNSFTTAEEAGTSMNAMLTMLSSNKTANTLKEMGIAVTDSEGRFRDLDAIMRDLSKHLAGVKDEQQRMAIVQDLFGTYGQKAALALMNQSNELPKLKKEMVEMNLIEEQTAVKLQGMNQQLEIANNKMDKAKLVMGEAMAPATMQMADATVFLAEKIEMLPPKLQTGIGVALEFGQTFIGIGPGISAVGAGLQTYAAISNSTLVPALLKAIPVQVAALGPWLLIAAAIAAVIVVAWLIYDNWEFISEKLKFIWEGLEPAFRIIWDGIVGAFKWAVDFITGLLFPNNSAPKRLTDAWTGVKDFFGKIWENIVGIFSGNWGKVFTILFPPIGIAQLIFENWGAIQKFFVDVWQAITRTFENAWTAIRQIVRWDDLTSGITNAWNGVINTLNGIWNSIVNLFRNNWKTILAILFPAVGIGSYVAQNWGTMVTAARDILQNVYNVFANFRNAIFTAGKNIGIGLWNGIASVAQDIYDRCRNFAKNVYNAVKSGMGNLWPFSPSKAGVNLGKGLITGIEKGVHDTKSILHRTTRDVKDELTFDPTTPGFTGVGGIGIGLAQTFPTQTGNRSGGAGQPIERVTTPITGNTFIIREEADIRKVARELERMRTTSAVKKGINSW